MSESKTKPPRSRLTPAEIGEATALYESGTVTLEDLGRRFGKRSTTFLRLFKKLGVVKGSKADETRERVREEVEKTVLDDAVTLANRIREVKEEHFKASRALFKLNWQEILQAKKEGKSLASINANAKALNVLIANFKMIREESYVVLGLDKDSDDDGDIPELPIHELTQEQIESMRKASAEPDIDDFDLDMEPEPDEDIPT